MVPTGQFPLFQLGTLLARQLSKPVADKIKRFAVDHPWFRRTVCARTGRVFYTLQLRLRLWTLALRQPLELPPLSEQAALNCGADILGEVAVFGLGGLIVIFEVNRQAEKQEEKLLDEESRRVALLLSLEELRHELALQQRDIDRLQAALQRLAPQHYRTSPHTEASPLPPTSAFTPLTPENPRLPTSASPKPPTSEGSTPPESPSPTSPTSEHSTPPKLDSPTPPTSDCSIPPITECPPPPISDCPPSET